MISKDIAELKRRFKKEDCTIQQMCGVYVDSDKNKISRIDSKFLTLPDEEYMKWLDIIKTMFNPKELYNKNMYLEASEEFEQQFWMMPIQQGCFSKEWLETFYEKMIPVIDLPGRFIIMLWLDKYDVLKRTSDNMTLDESEETYTYMMCAICPVDYDKPNLAYNPETSTFSPKKRSWEIRKPTMGFVYPAFKDRSSDVDSMLLYTGAPAYTDWNFVEFTLGMQPKYTTAEIQKIIGEIIEKQIEDCSMAKRIKMNLSYRCYLVSEDPGNEEQKINSDELKALLILDHVSSQNAAMIAEKFRVACEEYWPYYWQLADKKLVSLHKSIFKRQKMLKLLNKADVFIRENHGTNELTSEIDAVLNTERY